MVYTHFVGIPFAFGILFNEFFREFLIMIGVFEVLCLSVIVGLDVRRGHHAFLRHIRRIVRECCGQDS